MAVEWGRGCGGVKGEESEGVNEGGRGTESQLMRLTVPAQGCVRRPHRAPSDKRRGGGDEQGVGHEGGGGRRLLHFISSKLFQYL